MSEPYLTRTRCTYCGKRRMCVIYAPPFSDKVCRQCSEGGFDD